MTKHCHLQVVEGMGDRAETCDGIPQPQRGHSGLTPHANKRWQAVVATDGDCTG